MIIRNEDLKDACSKILAAVDSNELSAITETLELKVVDNTLNVSVTNREYYAQVRLAVDPGINFHATVNANLFLKLISQVTTESVELLVNDNFLLVKANGTYKFPLIFDDDQLLKLPEIMIDNVTNSFNISGKILNSLITYNSKEMLKGTIAKPVQKMYYMDQDGAITFTSGACVNEFKLDNPVRLLLNNRLVKLFKLFKDEDVRFTLGYDPISDEIVQTKVRFETDSVSVTAILACDDTLLNSVPVAGIRGRVNAEYPYSINLSKDSLIQTINRLLLFSSGIGGKENLKPYGTFVFNKDAVTVYDADKENSEMIYYNNSASGVEDSYTAVIDLVDFKTTLETCLEQYVTIKFGNGQAILVIRGTVYNVIPEVVTLG